jgi:hypothetical protein
MSVAAISYLFDAEPLGVPERPKRNTKAIGDRSELEAAVALARAGYIVSKPLGDSYRYDLIIDDGERLARVQVKTGRLHAGAVKFNCSSSHSHRGGSASRAYRGEIEFLAVYCPETGETYLVPEADLGNTKMHIRIKPTTNQQSRNINWAQTYRLP